jgi:hypothetical protein
MDTRALRRKFVGDLVAELRVVWPILSGLILVIVALGITAGLIEGRSLQESMYFAFVTGLTIGYGDLVPKALLTRVLAIAVGLTGVMLTAMVAAVAVKALGSSRDGAER